MLPDPKLKLFKKTNIKLILI